VEVNGREENLADAGGTVLPHDARRRGQGGLIRDVRISRDAIIGQESPRGLNRPIVAVGGAGRRRLGKIKVDVSRLLVDDVELRARSSRPQSQRGRLAGLSTVIAADQGPPEGYCLYRRFPLESVATK